MAGESYNMTLQYYIGGKITGLEADAKPLGVPEFTTFIETDTAKEFILVAGVYEQIGFTPPPPISVSELKAYWKFNETSGDIINSALAAGSVDSLGVAADLQVTGASFNNPNTPFNTMNFDGVNDSAVAGTSLSQFNFMHDGGKWTMCFWMENANISKEASPISNLTPANNMGISVDNLNATFLRMQVFDSGIWFARDMADPPPNNTMTFFVFQWDKDEATQKGKLFYDDIFQSGQDQSTTQGSSANSNSAMRIANPSGSASFAEINIAELSIWNRILTSGELTTLFNNGNGNEL